jgi:hypothetical protein
VTRPRHLALAAAVAAAGLSLTACDPPKAGSAAVVGTERISERTVSTTAQAVYKVKGTEQIPQAELNREIVRRMVTSQLVAELAKREDVTVTQGEVDDLIQQAIQGSTRQALADQLAQQAGVAPAEVNAYAHDFLLRQKLDEKFGNGNADQGHAVVTQKLGALSKKLGTTVSPRYGKWDAGSASVKPPIDDLSKPASPSPTS